MEIAIAQPIASFKEAALSTVFAEASELLLKKLPCPQSLLKLVSILKQAMLDTT